MQNWIKCSERMPEKYQRVMIWVEKKGVDMTWYAGKHFYGYHVRPHNVTHWQPLPEPPQE